MGAIFWIVAKIRQSCHEREFIIEGSQKWQGAAPSLIIKASVIKRVVWKEESIINVLERIIIEAMA